MVSLRGASGHPGLYIQRAATRGARLFEHPLVDGNLFRIVRDDLFNLAIVVEFDERGLDLLDQFGVALLRANAIVLRRNYFVEDDVAVFTCNERLCGGIVDRNRIACATLDLHERGLIFRSGFEFAERRTDGVVVIATFSEIVVSR